MARFSIVAVVLTLGLAPVAAAQTAATAAPPALALARLPSYSGATITVTSPAFKAGGDIPFENTQYRGNIFPGLSWAKSLPGTQAYVVILQDIDVVRGGFPLVHWSLLNVPPSVTALQPAMLTPPAGANYGPNFKGANQAYLGPHPPKGPKHRYHFQVFALDARIPDPGGSFEELIISMKGHVLASGELVGRAQFDANPPPPAGSLLPGAPPPASAAMAPASAPVAPRR